MKLRRITGLLAGLLSFGLLAAGPAAAAPVTVQLRIEGASRTLFEGPVTTDVRPFHFSGGADHTCNGTAANQGTSATPVVTRGAVVAAAADGTPFTTTGDWSDSFGSPSFSAIAGDSVAFDPATNRFLAEYKNGQFASLGSCADPVQAGDDVLFAYATGSEQLLELSAPGTASPGQTVRVKVTDAQSGAPVAGAAVGGTTSAADGTATVGPVAGGDNAFKASKAGAIRSNAVHVCATTGSDGLCGTSVPAAPCMSSGHDGLCGTADTTAPAIRIRKAYDGWYYSRRHAPRTLRGTVGKEPSGIKDVRVRLKRRVGRHCWSYSAGRERFVKRSCKRNASYFSVGDQARWSYLLPFRLRGGRYTLDAKVIDKAGNTSPLKRGRNRVVFHVL